MKIAIEGCAHGELDKIYESIQVLESNNNIKIDLLIICGDFQAVRNPTDLQSMAVPLKYAKLNTFYKYYSGEKKAPILTIFVGGNHEASNYLSELSYGGWVCPNIYYMGYANVINVGGVRIAGLSGIFKGHDYLKGHFESPPYDKKTVKSVYHVRNVDVFRLKQIRRPIDICLSHDWPRGVYHHGNMKQLLRFKPFFREEMESNKLGSQPAEELLSVLKPTYWFAAHLHCKFSAIVPHEDEVRPFTKFLALDKCLPRRRFLQVLEVGDRSEMPPHIEYDPEWLCILRSTNHLLNVSHGSSYMPGAGGNERWDFTATEEEIDHVKDLLNSEMAVPENFCFTAPKYVSKETFPKNNEVKKYLNPQTIAFCKTLSLTDPNQAVSCSNSFSISDFSGTETDISFSSLKSENPDEICCDSESEDDELSRNNDELISESADFFIDRVGTPRSAHKDEKISRKSDDPVLESIGFFIDTVGTPKSTGKNETFSRKSEGPVLESAGFFIDTVGTPKSIGKNEKFSRENDNKVLKPTNFFKDSVYTPKSTNKEKFLEAQFCSSTPLENKSTVVESFPELKDTRYEHNNTPKSTNKEKFLEAQFCSSTFENQSTAAESFPELKEKVLSPLDSVDEISTPKPIVFKRRNLALYANDSSEALTEENNGKKQRS